MARSSRLLFILALLAGALGSPWLARTLFDGVPSENGKARREESAALRETRGESAPAAAIPPQAPGSSGVPGADEQGGSGARVSLPAGRGASTGTGGSAPAGGAAEARLDQLHIFEGEVLRVLRSFSGLLKEQDQRRMTAMLRELDERQAVQIAARANALGVAMQRTRADGSVETLAGFEGDAPVYAFSEDAGGAISVATSHVRENPAFDAEFGAQLDGAGFAAAIFETAVMRQHSEFRLEDGTSRLIVRESPSGYTPTGHAEHVAGIIAAAGKNPEAKGMAPSATLHAWVYEGSSKISGDFLPYPKDGVQMVVSNSSYGIGSSTGRYDSADQTRDRYALTFPYTVMFTSLGNTGSNFATITGSFKESKNQIAVSNTYKLSRDAEGNPAEPILIYEGSSRGPPDDGRIVPFIAAAGTNIFSAGGGASGYTEDSYMFMTGTSMASPAAAGSTIILQQYFSKRFPGHLMRIDTVKALLAHTADDAGNAGPDYKHGFGLMNTLAAGKVIKAYADQPASRRLQHVLLPQGAVREYAFAWDGVSPIKATINWLDPEGPASAFDNDRTPALVNDLDLAIVSPSGVVHRPWVMPYVLNGFQAADYDTPAARGDNTVDNTEVVQIDAPTEPGVYTIRVSHKATLQDGEQSFSLVHSGFQVPAAAPAPVVTGCTNLGQGWYQIDGSGFLLGAQVAMVNSESVLAGRHMQVSDSRIVCRVRFADAGPQQLVVVNPDAQTAESSVIVPDNGIILTSDESTWVYSQNFDALTTDNAAAMPWEEDPPADKPNGLRGWYAGYFNALGVEASVAPEIRADNGATVAGRLYSYGSTGSTDRAFGTYRLDAAVQYNGTMRQALRVINRTGRTLTAFDLSFFGEQWRYGAGGTRNTTEVSYAVFNAHQGTMADLDGAYTQFAVFEAPRYTGGYASLDGNAAAYRTLVSQSVAGLDWKPGQELWICWSTRNFPAYDDGLAIDDLVFTARSDIPPTPFETFIASYGLAGPDTAPTAAPSGDGVSNLVKFALGGSPLNADTSMLPRGGVAGDANGAHFTITFPLRHAMTWDSEARALSGQGVVLVIEQSYDLSTWAPAGVVPADPVYAGGFADLPAGEIVFREAEPPAGQTKVFYRLRAQLDE